MNAISMLMPSCANTPEKSEDSKINRVFTRIVTVVVHEVSKESK